MIDVFVVADNCTDKTADVAREPAPLYMKDLMTSR